MLDEEYLDMSDEATQNQEISDDIEVKGSKKFKCLGFQISEIGTTENEIVRQLS